MLKKSALSIAIISALVLVTGCDKKQKTETVINATTASSTTLSTTASAPASTVTAVNAEPIASAPAVVASTTTVTTTTVASAPSSAMAPPMVAPTTTTKAATDSSTALKADLTALFKTLNDLDRKTAAKQAEMAKKMQNAKTPADQAAFFKDVVTQLDSQKTALNSLKFNDPRVGKVRDKMVESITNSRAGTQALIKTPTATPETHPDIAKNMQNAQKSAVEAREMLMKLAEEAGVKPVDNEKAPTKAK